jgi:hypothetical protein
MADGRLPLLSTTIVDADEIRRHLPEFSSYVENCPELVSKKMNKEAGYICELLCLAALQAGNNVIFDGWLRDPEWHNQQLQKLKGLYSHLKIALLHVTAPLNLIMERIEIRAGETGLHIPQEPVERILEEIPKNIEVVKHELDYLCTIHNGEDGDGDGGGLELQDDSWEHFTSTFTQEAETTVKEHIHKTGPPVRPSIMRRFASHEAHKSTASKCRRRSSRRLARRPFRVNVSTEENHKASHMKFYGKYSHIRETLDYGYHSNYSYGKWNCNAVCLSRFIIQ